jgi:3',5'-cyclic AMP phosphodiesterase CpdA
MSGTNPRLIAHLSDLHCGSPFFLPDLLDTAIAEVNAMNPDVVVVSGDLTAEGFLHDYELAAAYLQRIDCEHVVVIPGNHDSRNVGYLHFEDLIGPRSGVLHIKDMSIVAVDSTEPDLNIGTIGRGRYDWIREQFRYPADFRVFVLHHHLLPIPGTGRERNVVYDAGDTLEVLQQAGVDLVLSGHKHVPYAWQLESLFVVNAGTVSTTRLRGRVRPCYNVIAVSGEHVTIDQCFPGEGRERVIEFSRDTHEFKKYPLAAQGASRQTDV